MNQHVNWNTLRPVNFPILCSCVGKDLIRYIPLPSLINDDTMLRQSFVLKFINEANPKRLFTQGRIGVQFKKDVAVVSGPGHVVDIWQA